MMAATQDLPHPLDETRVRAWHTLTPAEAAAQLGLDSADGLGERQARERLAQFGPNRLHEEKREPIWETILEELREPMILLLLVTGALYAVWGEPSDAVVIFFVILTVVGVEIFNERRAERAIGALRRLAEPTAPVRRDGQALELPVAAIVPGDLVLPYAGRRVPADALLVEAFGLAVDESALTGESAPVEKEAGVTLPAATALAERRNLVFAGTTVTRGRGTALAIATGMQTELGRVAGMARAVKPPRTPLQLAMKELSRALVWVALGFSVLVPLLGVLIGRQPPDQMLLTGLSLAFATIPEEMPIIITLTLALGAYRLARQSAIVKRLQAVETLGTVTVIAADKTGSITENRMQVSRQFPAGAGSWLLELGALASASAADGAAASGDPLDAALLRAARQAGLDGAARRHEDQPRHEFAFDEHRKLMSVVYARDGELLVAAKGAPEAILARSSRWAAAEGERALADLDRRAILSEAAAMAADGLRVIGLAARTLPADSLSQAAAERDLAFAGLIGLADPPRPEVVGAIAECFDAGIRIMMITGDHPATAVAIARQVGLDGAGRTLTGPELDAVSDDALREAAGQVAIYARTTPEHKLRLVQALHARGERVAMTGDGVNDAPALAAADIGVAMGRRGTDVAREAADIVLADDNFATIVRAIEEGRLLFANLTKAVRYYLACDTASIPEGM